MPAPRLSWSHPALLAHPLVRMVAMTDSVHPNRPSDSVDSAASDLPESMKWVPGFDVEPDYGTSDNPQTRAEIDVAPKVTAATSLWATRSIPIGSCRRSEVLREWLSDRNLSARVAVASLPREDRYDAAVAVQQVLDDGPLAYETALMLDRVTGIATRFLLAFEHNYRTGLAEGKSVIR